MRAAGAVGGVTAGCLLAALVGCGAGAQDRRMSDPARTAAASADPSRGAPANPTASERASGQVELARTVNDIRIGPPAVGARAVVSRSAAWQTLRATTPGANANADETWVLLADYDADTPAHDPDMDGQDMAPYYVHRLSWVLMQFGVPGEVYPHGSFGATAPPERPAYMDVIAGVDATTGAELPRLEIGRGA